MRDIPTPETLARLVSNVTTTMFGMSFQLTPGTTPRLPWDNAPAWRTMVLAIDGARPIVVAIASDEPSGKVLGGAMFSCPPAEVDAQMVDDSLSELLNIIAGQVKLSMGLDQALGLPRLHGGSPLNSAQWRTASLQSNATSVKVWVAITESV